GSVQNPLDQLERAVARASRQGARGLPRDAGEALRLRARAREHERRDEGRLPLPRVLAGRLAERARVAGDVEDVVDRLEAAAEGEAEGPGRRARGCGRAPGD